KMREIIYAGYADENETLATIKSVYHNYHYLVDPHTAVGINVFSDYQNASKSKTKTVLDATATPFKFNRAVLTSLLGENLVHNKDELILLQMLSEYTGLAIPAMLQDLGNKPIKNRFIYPKERVKESLLEVLKI
nr:threonine synthase [Candidatus Atribacteria bacterium]